MVEGSIELVLNKYLELISPKEGVKQDDIDSKGEIIVYTRDEDYDQYKILKITNYGNHIIVSEYYYSYIGEIEVRKGFHGVKPSEVLRLYLPHLFK
jgi:hypothetical protein